MQTLQTTVQELADKLGVDYGAARGFVSVLLKHGFAKEAGKQTKDSNGIDRKGKPSTVYEIVSHIELDLPL